MHTYMQIIYDTDGGGCTSAGLLRQPGSKYAVHAKLKSLSNFTIHMQHSFRVLGLAHDKREITVVMKMSHYTYITNVRTSADTQ